MTMISKYFTDKEMRCKCENCMHTCAMDSIFLILLDKVREETGGPVKVNSGFRCNSHNKKIGGVKSSWHTKGKAADCVPTKVTLEELKKIADKYFDEVILYKEKGFVHIGEPKQKYILISLGD